MEGDSPPIDARNNWLPHNQSLEQTKDARSFDIVCSNPWLLSSKLLCRSKEIAAVDDQ